MRRIILPLIALSLAVVPAAVEAQTPRAERGQSVQRGMAWANPAARVLAYRETLGLSLEQVRQLQQIEAQLAQRNQQLAEELRAAAPAFRGAFQAGRGAAALTPEQRAELR
jgi:hypothetical protein